MTVLAWTPPPVGFTDVATLRAWLADLDTKIQAVGLVRTADTGQIDTSTIALPSGGGAQTITNLGYFIYRFNDALQATSPIFIRLVISSRGQVVPRKYPFSYVSVGTGTDGAGNLTGVVSGVMSNNFGYVDPADPIAAPATISRAVCNYDRGFFGLVYCPATFNTNPVVNYSPVCFFISRTQNADGTPNAKGFSICARNDTNGGDIAYNIVSSPFSGPVAALGYHTVITGVGAYPSAGVTPYAFPFFPVQDIIGTDPQLQRAYSLTPAVEPNYNLLSVPRSAYSDAIEFTALSGGSSPKNFITIGHMAGARPNTITTGNTLAMLWE